MRAVAIAVCALSALLPLRSHGDAVFFFEGFERYEGGTNFNLSRGTNWWGYGSDIGVFAGANPFQAYSGTNFLYSGSGLTWGSHVIYSWSNAQDLTQLDSVSYWVWSNQDDDDLQLSIRMVDAGSANEDGDYFVATLGAVPFEWTNYTASRSRFTVGNGSPSWSNIDRLVLRCSNLLFPSGANSDQTLRFDDITITTNGATPSGNFNDHFPGSEPNIDHWSVSDGKQLGNTEFASSRVSASGSWLNLQHHLAGGPPYQGAEVKTTASYGYGKYRARMQAPSNTPGVVCAFFVCAYEGGKTHEIDVELMSGATNTIMFSTWKDWNNDGNFHTEIIHDTNINVHAPHIYGFDWDTNYIAFFVDNAQMTSWTTHVPAVRAPIYFNCWSPTGVTNWAIPNQPPTADAVFKADWCAVQTEKNQTNIIFSEGFEECTTDAPFPTTDNGNGWWGYGSFNEGVYCYQNADEAHSGSKFLQTGSGQSWGSYTVHTWPFALDLSSFNHISLWYWAPVEDTNLSLSVRLVDQHSPSKDDHYFMAQAGTVESNWNIIYLTDGQFAVGAGSPSWERINRLVLQCDSVGSDPDSTIRFDDIVIDSIPEPAMLVVSLCLLAGCRFFITA